MTVSTLVRLGLTFGAACAASQLLAVAPKTQILQNTCNRDSSMRFGEVLTAGNRTTLALSSSQTFFVGTRGCKVQLLVSPPPRHRLTLSTMATRGRGIVLSGTPSVSYGYKVDIGAIPVGAEIFMGFNTSKPVSNSTRFSGDRFSSCGQPVVLDIGHRAAAGGRGTFDVRVENFSVQAIMERC